MLPSISATDLGEYIRHRSCDRRFHLSLNREAIANELPFFALLSATMDPILMEAGQKREDEWEAQLQQAGHIDLVKDVIKGKHSDVKWAEFADKLQQLAPGQNAYAQQVRLAADVGAFRVSGLIDFVIVNWQDGLPVLTVVECKASRKDRTYHRIQLATYRILLNALDVNVENIHFAVARIDETTNINQNILAIKHLDLRNEEADVRALLGVHGRLNRIRELPLLDVNYQIDAKCDECTFNIHCMTESARLRRLELLGIDPVCTRKLHDAGLKTLDDLANPPVFNDAITALGRDPAFAETVDSLSKRAKTRLKHLPGGEALKTTYEVEAIPYSGSSHLPPHESDGRALLRIYLTVDVDYSEDRLVALTAHVTRSPGRIHTASLPVGDEWEPNPIIREQMPVVGTLRVPSEQNGTRSVPATEYAARNLQAREVLEYQASRWSGDHAADTQRERDMIVRFFTKLIDAMRTEAGEEEVPVHFYVWSPRDIDSLLEACARAGPEMLGYLRELFGCREGLEQLLYSPIQPEIDRRYVLGWTGRTLAVVSSLRWFGRYFHWRRIVGDEVVDLDHAFSHGIFDFKNRLDTDGEGRWVARDTGTKHLFEVRSKFADALPIAYWHAIWGILKKPEEVTDGRVKASLVHYHEAGKRAWIEALLTARCHAIRWLEENVTPKNREIDKPLIKLSELPDFKLESYELGQSAIDFLLLDQHVKRTNWLNAHMAPPIATVPLGRVLPLTACRVEDTPMQIKARIRMDGFHDLSLADMETRSGLDEGSFVRLIPWNGDPQKGSSPKQLTSFIGRTCVIDSIDWKTGFVTLQAMPMDEDDFTLSSGGASKKGMLFDNGFGLLIDSVTDFVARRVYRQLDNLNDTARWFDPLRPAIPAWNRPSDPAKLAKVRQLVTGLKLPGGYPPAADQAKAVMDGVDVRVQLLQGPPGTGKTTTTALAILTRVLLHQTPGNIVLISAHTHRALDELLERIHKYLSVFTTAANAGGLRCPKMHIVKLHSGDIDTKASANIQHRSVSQMKSAKGLKEFNENAVLILGGTPAGLLKLAQEKKPASYNGGRGFTTSLLIVDEASMLVFPHFLALTTLVTTNGQIMLAGDHRQLSPITAHEWDDEDRPPTVAYEPFVSAYLAIDRLVNNASVIRSQLRETFRLPNIVRELIAKVYVRDDLVLTGPDRPGEAASTPANPWECIWAWNRGIFLVVHDEDRSRQSNEVELAIVIEIMKHAPTLPVGSTAIVTPHRAQRSLFQTKLGEFYGPGKPIDTIDTVERLQGGERSNIIVSGTVTDPTAIEAEVEFILDLNRSNVAFSRVKDRLIVVCSHTLLNHIPADAEQYDSAELWKALRAMCNVTLGEVVVASHRVQIQMPTIPQLSALYV